MDRFWTTPALLALALAACGGSTSTGAGSTGSPSVAQSAAVRIPASRVAEASIGAAVAANNEFAVDLYTRVRAKAPAGNLLTSPISASLALTMTYTGAAGRTATQMAAALHFGAASGEAIRAGQNALSQVLAQRAKSALDADAENASAAGGAAPSPDDYALQVVNSVWGQKSYPWEASFLDVLAQDYGAGVFLEDFAAKPDPARLAINAWVSESTAMKINDLLPPASIDADTRMVLVNAIHVKLPWATAFPASATMPASFTTGGGGVTVPFMHQTLEAGYADDGAAQIVSLPLANDQLRVVVALPRGDLATYEGGLSATSQAFQPLGTSTVALSLPKVTFTSPTFSMSDALQAMGMVDAFDGSTANFTGMCAHPPDGNLYVSDVLQKAMLGMQETGVEAAAATAVVLTRESAVAGPPVTMVVDRPFVVAIIDATGAILFLGHIEDPTATGGP